MLRIESASNPLSEVLPKPGLSVSRMMGVICGLLSMAIALPACVERDTRSKQSKETTLTIDALTSRIGHPERVWRVADSAAWVRTRDSISIEMSRPGGKRFVCEPNSIPAMRIQDALYWNFPGFVGRLTAYPVREPSGRRWLLRIDGYGKEFIPC
jgi:hypothetical protein